MLRENYEEEQKISIHLIGFELRKELLKSKDISIKISTISENPKCSNSSEESKATISVEKIQKANLIFNVNVKIPDEMTVSFKIKDKLSIEHKIAYANINYKSIINILDESKDNNKKSKFKYLHDKIQKIPIFMAKKHKLKENSKSKGSKYDSQQSNEDSIVGYMKIQLSVFQNLNNSGIYDIKKDKKSNFISSHKPFSINMHKFKNYHISEKQSSEFQRSENSYQFKKRYENLL